MFVNAIRLILNIAVTAIFGWGVIFFRNESIFIFLFYLIIFIAIIISNINRYYYAKNINSIVEIQKDKKIIIVRNWLKTYKLDLNQTQIDVVNRKFFSYLNISNKSIKRNICFTKFGLGKKHYDILLKSVA